MYNKKNIVMLFMFVWEYNFKIINIKKFKEIVLIKNEF